MAKSYLHLPATFPIGIRRNNPGNLVRSGAAFAGVTTRADTKRGSQFFAFVDVPHGLLAMSQLITGYINNKGLNTIAKISGKYLEKKTTQVERNRWVAQVSRNAGLSISQVLTTSPDVLKNLCLGIVMKETGLKFHKAGQTATITSADYDEAMSLQSQLEYAYQSPQDYAQDVALNVLHQLDLPMGLSNTSNLA